MSLDTDVFISVVVFDDHSKIDKLWTTFGKGEDLRWIPIQDIVRSLGPGSKALSFSHAFKGCDTVSAFVGKYKTQHRGLGRPGMCLKTSKKYSFIRSPCDSITEHIITELEDLFVVIMYDQ